MVDILNVVVGGYFWFVCDKVLIFGYVIFFVDGDSVYDGEFCFIFNKFF